MKQLIIILAIFASTALTASAQNYLQWATYYGGNDQDIAYNLTVDPFGNVYLIGQTESTSGIATAGAHQTTIGGGVDAFIVKFNSSGARLWATYYGGAGSDIPNGVKTDAAGNVYLTGYTSSTTSIATAGSFQPAMAGAPDAFIVKFNSAGTRLWATYYGGVDYEQGQNVATDAAGNAYFAGFTTSTSGIATVGAYQTTGGGAGISDAFLVKFDSNGNRIWATYFGGPNPDGANDIASDASGNVVFSGFTYSTTGIASGGFQNSFGGGNTDAFVAKFNSAGLLQWSTYYGGTGNEEGFGICTGPGDIIYLADMTSSASGIASGGYQNTFGGINDAYLVKFSPSGARLWATYYGGPNEEEGYGVATDLAGNVFLGGDVYSTNVGNNIATAYAVQNNIIGTENSFLATFNSNGVRLAATYYGRVHEESTRVAVNAFGSAYISFWTMATTGLTSNGFQNTYGGNPYDGCLVKFYTAVPDTNIVVPNDNLPPVITAAPTTTMPPKIYVTSGIYNAASNSITNATFKNFSPGSPLPITGSSTVTFTCDFTGTYNGSTSIPVTGTVIGQMKATYVYTSGSTRVYDTEMLQLDLSGGTLPTGVKLRESPTLVSTGQTLVTPVGGGLYSMSSFFDVFTELSTDNGSSWQPSAGAPARLGLQNDSVTSSVPTLSEWGLIALSVLVVSMGLFFVSKRIA